MTRLLLDEHMNRAVQRDLRRRSPELTVWRVGDIGAPPKGTPDPDLLNWCESTGALLASKDYATMPVHVAAHLALGRHVPGVFLIPERMGIGQIVEELYTIALASLEHEHRDVIRYLPLL